MRFLFGYNLTPFWIIFRKTIIMVFSYLFKKLHFRIRSYLFNKAANIDRWVLTQILERYAEKLSKLEGAFFQLTFQLILSMTLIF
ncbi:MAG: hypothetical protein A3E87_07540 [Gammaproteobacteria bacterium RIFCSPHIGHO2_12_FULL_35_23]|nr:MAG: hypothetical protein A3E87_07540 [Gammaproteobacteria bacterium RIFCSPHIGHO2_12_FULL_35_23]